MRIHTTRQGLIEILSIQELWHAQIRYLSTTLARYASDVPSWNQFYALRYQSDPKGIDSWLTPRQALGAGGDDCEGLTNLLLSRICLDLPTLEGLPALPILAKFGSGNVIHAVSALAPAVAIRLGLERFAFTSYPVLCPHKSMLDLSGYWIIDPSWILGMGIPDEYLHLVSMPQCKTRRGQGKLYCEETPSWIKP